jgi:hypothetical protein
MNKELRENNRIVAQLLEGRSAGVEVADEAVRTQSALSA